MSCIRRRSTLLSGLVALLSVTVPLVSAGCGSGGGTVSPPTSSTNVTRQTEGLYSSDAKILAARATTTPWLSLSDTARFDTQLKRIRSQYPTVQNIHAQPDFTLTDLIVTVSANAPFLSRWQSGTLTTGDTSLDAFLTQYDAISVTPLGTPDAHQFTLHFGQSMNMRALVPIAQAASSSLTSVSVNAIIGDGDRIMETINADGSYKYVLSRGWGDCTAGCIFRHAWQFTVSADGSSATQTQETGTPLPTTP